jgi:hypothetical protein
MFACRFHFSNPMMNEGSSEWFFLFFYMVMTGVTAQFGLSGGNVSIAKIWRKIVGCDSGIGGWYRSVVGSNANNASSSVASSHYYLRIACKRGGNMTPEEIERMNWLCKRIEEEQDQEVQ